MSNIPAEITASHPSFFYSPTFGWFFLVFFSGLGVISLKLVGGGGGGGFLADEAVTKS